ncbi:hypothetical protein ACIA49_38740 [Kribbella sp. NPDC051587]|uniref:hypothetical protein n=1 Tax=Kribbella sp. NPDC051587 TaxID=3364119 RepID=UPI0037B56FF9
MSEWVPFEGDEPGRLIHEWRKAFAADDQELMAELKQQLVALAQPDHEAPDSAV